MSGRLQAWEAGGLGRCLEMGPVRWSRLRLRGGWQPCFITCGALLLGRNLIPQSGALHHSLVSMCWRLEVRDQGAGWLSSFHGP